MSEIESKYDLVAVRKRHKKTLMNTDPSGIHYSGYGVDYDGCSECEMDWPCDAILLADEVERLRKEVADNE